MVGMLDQFLRATGCASIKEASDYFNLANGDLQAAIAFYLIHSIDKFYPDLKKSRIDFEVYYIPRKSSISKFKISVSPNSFVGHLKYQISQIVKSHDEIVIVGDYNRKILDDCEKISSILPQETILAYSIPSNEKGDFLMIDFVSLKREYMHCFYSGRFAFPLLFRYSPGMTNKYISDIIFDFLGKFMKDDLSEFYSKFGNDLFIDRKAFLKNQRIILKKLSKLYNTVTRLYYNDYTFTVPPKSIALRLLVPADLYKSLFDENKWIHCYNPKNTQILSENIWKKRVHCDVQFTF